MTDLDLIRKIRGLKPVLYVSSDGEIPEQYKTGFADGFYDALEQIDAIYCSSLEVADKHGYGRLGESCACGERNCIFSTGHPCVRHGFLKAACGGDKCCTAGAHGEQNPHCVCKPSATEGGRNQ